MASRFVQVEESGVEPKGEVIPKPWRAANIKDFCLLRAHQVSKKLHSLSAETKRCELVDFMYVHSGKELITQREIGQSIRVIASRTGTQLH